MVVDRVVRAGVGDRQPDDQRHPVERLKHPVDLPDVVAGAAAVVGPELDHRSVAEAAVVGRDDPQPLGGRAVDMRVEVHRPPAAEVALHPPLRTQHHRVAQEVDAGPWPARPRRAQSATGKAYRGRARTPPRWRVAGRPSPAPPRRAAPGRQAASPPPSPALPPRYRCDTPPLGRREGGDARASRDRCRGPCRRTLSHDPPADRSRVTTRPPWRCSTLHAPWVPPELLDPPPRAAGAARAPPDRNVDQPV